MRIIFCDSPYSSEVLSKHFGPEPSNVIICRKAEAASSVEAVTAVSQSNSAQVTIPQTQNVLLSSTTAASTYFTMAVMTGAFTEGNRAFFLEPDCELLGVMGFTNFGTVHVQRLGSTWSTVTTLTYSSGTTYFSTPITVPGSYRLISDTNQFGTAPIWIKIKINLNLQIPDTASAAIPLNITLPSLNVETSQITGLSSPPNMNSIDTEHYNVYTSNEPKAPVVSYDSSKAMLAIHDKPENTFHVYLRESSDKLNPANLHKSVTNMVFRTIDPLTPVTFQSSHTRTLAGQSVLTSGTEDPQQVSYTWLAQSPKYPMVYNGVPYSLGSQTVPASLIGITFPGVDSTSAISTIDVMIVNPTHSFSLTIHHYGTDIVLNSTVENGKNIIAKTVNAPPVTTPLSGSFVYDLVSSAITTYDTISVGYSRYTSDLSNMQFVAGARLSPGYPDGYIHVPGMVESISNTNPLLPHSIIAFDIFSDNAATSYIRPKQVEQSGSLYIIFQSAIELDTLTPPVVYPIPYDDYTPGEFIMGDLVIDNGIGLEVLIDDTEHIITESPKVFHDVSIASYRYPDASITVEPTISINTTEPTRLSAFQHLGYRYVSVKNHEPASLLSIDRLDYIKLKYGSVNETANVIVIESRDARNEVYREYNAGEFKYHEALSSSLPMTDTALGAYIFRN